MIITHHDNYCNSFLFFYVFSANNKKHKHKQAKVPQLYLYEHYVNAVLCRKHVIAPNKAKQTEEALILSVYFWIIIARAEWSNSCRKQLLLKTLGK